MINICIIFVIIFNIDYLFKFILMQNEDINNMMEDSPRFEKCISTTGTNQFDNEKEKFTIDEKKLSKCCFSDSTKLTNDLLSVVFTKLELQTSTITGEKANLHLDKPAKNKLNEAKVAFIYGE